MGRIQASTGIFSGVNFTDTISQLMAIESKPRDALTATNTMLTNQQTAVTTLSALLLSVQYITKNLGKAATFDTQTAASSDATSLTATVTSTAAVGNYQYTPVQAVQSQQFLGAGMQSMTSALGGGTFDFRFGNGVDAGMQLSAINGGKGFARGKIQITDRSGVSAQIDLSTAQSIDDVINTINGNTTINVTAVADGDHLRLVDNTGETVSDLKVKEVSGGTTAASLGLAGIDVASGTAVGQSIVKLSSNTSLATLNDGNGVSTSQVLPDIQYTLHDGTTGTIDLSPIASGTSTVQKETTLGQIIQEINAQSGGAIQASISTDGKRLVVTDTTTSGDPENPGSFTLTGINGSGALNDLGLGGTADTNTIDGNTITGGAIIGGLKSPLLSSLNGGQGLGALGDLDLTDGNGTAVTVHLGGSETLNDVIGKINAQAATAGVKITASVNRAGDGIQLVDSSGGAAVLTAANGSDGAKTGDALGLTSGSIDSGTLQGSDLHLQVVSRNTQLSSLNGGAGIGRGSFTISDSAGKAVVVDLSSSSIQTVGDVIDTINRVSTGVHAQLNATGDGIAIEDLGNGTGTLSVTEGRSTTARDLHLLGGAITPSGSSTQRIDGAATASITLESTDTLSDLVNKINSLGAGLTASVLNDGSSSPYHLSLTSTQAGKGGNLVVDASGIAGLTLQQTTRGQNALLAIGDTANPAASTLISSTTNQFQNVLPGVTLQVQNPTGKPVNISITQSDTSVVANLQTFVTNYNKFRAELTKDTTYTTATNTGSVLTGDSSALQLDTQLSNLLSGSFNGVGSIRSLSQLGITMQTDETLAFDQTTFESAYSANSQSVQQFFTTATTGFSAKMDSLLERLAGTENSLLSSRITALSNQIDDNQRHITQMNAQLTSEQNRLYTQFYNMELTIGKLQADMNVVNAITPLDFVDYSSKKNEVVER